MVPIFGGRRQQLVGWTKCTWGERDLPHLDPDILGSVDFHVSKTGDSRNHVVEAFCYGKENMTPVEKFLYHTFFWKFLAKIINIYLIYK